MPIDMEAGLGPGDFALHGTQLSLLKKAAAIFGACLLWPNGWMDQEATSYKGRPRPS